LVIKIGLFAVFTFGVIAGWWLYVGYYRNLHHTSYFQTNSNPIWGTKDGEILRTLKHFWIWMNHYFNFPSIIVAGALLIFALKIFYKKDKLVFLFYIILMLGCAGYMLLFFPNFYFHDYYIIVVLPLFIAALFLFVIAMRDTYPDVFFTDRFSTVVLLFFLLNVGYAAYKTHQRNTDLNFTKDNHVQLAHIEPYLDSIGIRQNDFVIYWGDFAPNIAFYLMNRRGWGQWALGCTLSQQNIDSCTSMGAKFLIIDRNQCILDDAKRNLINRYGSHKISDRDSIQIYSLR
jgi:NADH:ubiquinone oxidoreductase subunit 6 (subunit J)